MRVWAARILVFVVFAINVYCALLFVFFPEGSMAAYELTGASGRVALQGIGVVFMMWNCTYPLVILNPQKYRALFTIVIAQQIVGLIGESLILIHLPDGHALLAQGILRFIIFDSAGLVGLITAFLLSRKNWGAKYG
ncbi:MAG: hypothetical protein LBH87_01970 [Coriobacteriales bacterium]|nr:hypothetical protein [Coriobacteriales bacterium]